MKTLLKFVSLAAVLAACAPLAIASPIALPDPTAGGTVGTTTASNIGTLVATSNLLSASPTPLGNAKIFTVNYIETVTMGGADAMCPTCLNFTYQFNNTGATGSEVQSISMSFFDSFDISAAYIANGFEAPTSDSRVVGNIGFKFSPVFPGSGNVDEVVLFTNATSYDDQGTLTFQDGLTAQVGAFEPTATPAVPEPSSLALLGTGLVSVVGMARRRLKV